MYKNNLGGKNYERNKSNGLFERLFHLNENKTSVKNRSNCRCYHLYDDGIHTLPLSLHCYLHPGWTSGAVFFTATTLWQPVWPQSLWLFYPIIPSFWPWDGAECLFCFYSCPWYGIYLADGVNCSICRRFDFYCMSLTNVREAIFNAIPMTLKQAVTVGNRFIYRFYRTSERKDRC